jgi:hypothetical protein
MNLVIYVNDDARQPDAERAWTAFEQSVQVPVAYRRPVAVRTCNDHPGAVAAAAIHDRHLKILLTAEFFDLPAGEQTLTLLHESCHIKAFTGALKELYWFGERLKREQRREILERTQRTGPIREWMQRANAVEKSREWAQLVAEHLFEVDAEFTLRDMFPEHAAARAAYLVRAKERRFTTTRLEDTPLRCYEIALARLRAELAGILADDENVTEALMRQIAAVPGFAADCAGSSELYRLVSPTTCDYSKLPTWGRKAYETIVRQAVERAIDRCV